MSLLQTVLPAGYTPAAVRQTLATNYIDFTTQSTSAADVNWAQQYLPDLMEKEAEVFGNRTISGFLSQVGAEESMSADQVIWSEQGRLHLAYKDVALTASAKVGTLTWNVGTQDADGKTVAAADHGVRAGDMILMTNGAATIRCFVTSRESDHSVKILRYDDTNITNGTMTETDVDILVYGSEYSKGTIGRDGANKPSHLSRANKPIILKDKYEISGSDAAQIGWVEISGEEGQSGYMWYLKASGDTKARFSDYLEMAMCESTSGPGITTPAALGSATLKGTEGLWEALETRGNISNALDGASPSAALTEFDDIIDELDANGAIEENMLFLDRATALGFDDMLASISSGAAGGTAFGLFENSEEMALNLGFSGFRRGSYDFYKTDWKYLNDASTRGGMTGPASIEGVLIPAGTTTVYDQILGTNIRRPFLHVRYRASQGDDRRMKSWLTGSAGGAFTSDLDAMEVNFLSERCLVTQAANNFVLFKGV